MTMTDYYGTLHGVEVTHEEHKKRYPKPPLPKATEKHSFRLKRLLRPNKNKQTAPDNVSVASDQAAASVVSASNITVESNDTIKHSNSKRPQMKLGQMNVAPETADKKKTGWSEKLKFRKNATPAKPEDESRRRKPASTPDQKENPGRERVFSEDSAVSAAGIDKFRHDEEIRGRLDGLDVLSLGPARMVSIPNQTLHDSAEDFNKFTSNMAPKLTPYAITMEMLWTSAGKDPAEIVLEGFIPNGKDRWVVKMDKAAAEARARQIDSSGHYSPMPSLVPTDDDLSASEQGSDCMSMVSCSDDGAASASINELLTNMWGSESVPATHNRRNSGSSGDGDLSSPEEDDDVLQMAAACLVPIDVDEETFIIENAHHLEAVHNIAKKPLQQGRYNVALDVFGKILKGLWLKHDNKPHYLIGSTYHNIGLIKVWMGDFVGAAEAFQQAIAIRKVTLRRHHPDVGVSYVRKGVCDFALGSFDTAVESMEKALRCCHDESVVKAKILNNLGVMHYHRQDLIQSLKGFAGALEIQRHSLAGPIKRESIVFDASMTLCNMGKLFLEKGDYAAAYSVYEEGLTLQTIAFPRKSILVMLSLGNLAYCKAKNSEPKKALQIYKRVLRLQEGMYGDESREVMETVGVMGLLYHQIKDYKKAQAHLTRVSRWQMYFMNARNPAVQQIKEYLKKIEGKLEEEESAVWI